MKIPTMRSVLSFAAIALLFIALYSCKSSKEVAEVKSAYEDEVEIKQFCTGPEYQSSEGFIRAGFYGESNDMAISKKVAKSNTLAELASKVEISVKAVIDDYNSRRQKNLNESIEQRYEEMIRQTVNQTITGYKTICEKVTKTKQNKYRTYLVYELPVDNVLNPVFNNISKDDELKVDYDYQKFKKTFEEEMQKAENR